MKSTDRNASKKTELKKALERAQRYNPDIKTGLEGTQIKSRKAENLVNVHDDGTKTDIRVILFKNIFTYFNILNFIIAYFIFYVGAYKNLLFMGVVVTNTLIGIAQEIKAKRETDKMTLRTKSKSKVVRSGAEVLINADEIVVDDITVLQTGDEVPADSVIKDGEVKVNESILTGEPDEKPKFKGDFLYAGSFIASGFCHAKVEFVGALNYSSDIINTAKKYRKLKSPLINAIRFIIRIISFCLVPLGAALFILHFFYDKETLYDSVVTTAAAVIGMIPEGLVLLTSITLTVGVLRLARKKVMVKELFSIENLARVDTVCFDKTGTITTGKMKVRDVEYNETNMSELSILKSEVSEYLNSFAESTETIKAIQKLYSDAGKSINCISQIHFSSSTKYSGIITEEEIVLLGAYDILSENRNFEFVSSAVKKSLPSDRILLLCKADKKYTYLFDGQNSADLSIIEKIEPLCLFFLTDEIRKNIRETIDFLYNQGTDIKIISGDNPKTAAVTASLAGVRGTEKYADLSKMSDGEIMSLSSDEVVYGRVKPHQKALLIKMLKAKGRKVAMTGDGINDVMALREADCSIAPASGSTPALNVAQIVLLDSSYEHIPSVINEGRRVINNVERSAILFLIKTFMSIFLAVATLAIPFFEYPFVPIQLSLIGGLFIGIPSYFLSLEKNEHRVRSNFLRNVFIKAIPFSLLVFLGVLFFNVQLRFNPKFSNTELYSSAAVILGAFCFFCADIYLCKPFKKYHMILLLSCGGIFCAAYFLFGNFFYIEPFSGRLILLVSCMVLLFLYILIVKILVVKIHMKLYITFLSVLFASVIIYFNVFFFFINK